MARRPTRIPRWGYDAASGALVEPPIAEAAAGWTTAQRPPAQYLNWLFNLYGSWTSWLAGPSVSDWTRRTLPNPSTDVARIAYDSTTEDDIEARYRYVLVGKDVTGPFAAVSRTGIDWITRRNIGGTPGDPRGVYLPPIATEAFWLWTDAAGKTYYTSPDTVANTATNPLRNSGGTWAEVALDDAAAYPVGFAEGPSVGAICSTSTGIEYRANGSYASWTTHASPPGTRQEGRACCWTGTAFLDFSSDAGDLCVSRALTASGTWTVVATVTGLSAGTLWRVALGATSTADAVIAVHKDGTTDVDLHFSEDDGLTWTPVAVPAAMSGITGLAYYDGTWVASALFAPHAWSSSDLVTWTPLPIPAGTTITQLRDVVYGAHGWLLTSREGCLQGAPAVDVTPGAWTPDTAPLALGNAGWLRGKKISITAPTDGQVLTYVASSGQYEPATPSGGGGGGSSAPATLGHSWERPAPASVAAGTSFICIDDLTEQVSTGLAVSSGVAASGWAQRLPTGLGAGRAGLVGRAYVDSIDLSAYAIGVTTLACLYQWDGITPGSFIEVVSFGDRADEQRGIHVLLVANGANTDLVAWTGEAATVLLASVNLMSGAAGLHSVAIAPVNGSGHKWRFSYDGSAVADVAMTANYVAPSASDSIGFGARADGAAPLTGKALDLAVWGSLLSNADILALATLPATPTYEIPESASTGAAVIMIQARRFDPRIVQTLPARGLATALTVLATKVTL